MQKAILATTGFILLALFCSLTTLGQTYNTPLAQGYDPPTYLTPGRGQVLTIYAAGFENEISGPLVANANPLPTVLGGLAVKTTDNILLPILSVVPIAFNRTAAITIQVPFEMSLHPGVNPHRGLSVEENGRPGARIPFRIFATGIHILRDCDTIYFPPLSSSCAFQIVTHEDGGQIIWSAPAKPGEVVTIHAVGLGATNPQARTGELVQMPLPVAGEYLVDFEFAPNAAPKDIRRLPPEGFARPLFAGLVPGKVGLYHIKVKIPEVPRGTPRCEGAITSNLTITIARPAVGSAEVVPDPGSFDGVRLCVEVGSSPRTAAPRRIANQAEQLQK